MQLPELKLTAYTKSTLKVDKYNCASYTSLFTPSQLSELTTVAIRATRHSWLLDLTTIALWGTVACFIVFTLEFDAYGLTPWWNKALLASVLVFLKTTFSKS